MAKQFKELVLKPFERYGRRYERGDIYRIVSITDLDANFLNDRKEDFGFEYIEVKNEEVETIKETMETPQPKRGFPKKKF